MGQFADMLEKEESLGYVHRLAMESEKVLEATLLGKEDVTCAPVKLYQGSGINH